ncbi:NUDIX domain-containing protein [Nonomuraea aurantiaca]|uniref:NUDIX domain-containing protein n=1 Tax=Nonomuraea aurantiaca TaxID=2878562 RepID=UPI001CD98DB8|nr:NUDIX domain-containing protein [Nonomuraea aurantiaca]MCA2227386.1 NUDIX domain-containing protein [Nonomuraea aurantiaca]
MTACVTFTHPDVFDRGIQEGWADPQTDPTQIDWTPRQTAAAIPFQVIDGRPVNPCETTCVRYGRNELGHWGEQVAADAVVTAHTQTGRWLVMVERSDGHGWAVPGGYVEPGEDPEVAAVRELAEETCLNLSSTSRQVLPARYVPDPRASDEAWMVTVPVTFKLCALFAVDLPAVVGADDAKRAAWVRANSYTDLVAQLKTSYDGQVFRAHVAMLRDLLG